MSYLLDTNVLAELRKVRSGKADSNVAKWADSVDAAELYVSVISIMEVELGVLSLERKDKVQGAHLRRWLEQQVIPEFSERTLPVDLNVARVCAGLHVPDKRAERDAMIAATAIVHGMTVVTRNVKDFEQAGVALLNPWA
jgi:predicted nucleic acid-binding protein